MINYAFIILTEEVNCLKSILLTWIVDIIFRGRMSAKEIDVVMSLVISFLKGYTDKVAESEI